MPHTYGYVRVSRVEQELSPHAQMSAIRGYCEIKKTAAFGTPLPPLKEPFFEDLGVCSQTPFLKRPNGAKLFALLRKGDVVVFSKMDRAFRDLRDAINTVAEIYAVGADLVFLDKQIDTTTAAGRFMFHVMAAAGEFERDRLRERTKEAMQILRRSCKRYSKYPPFGTKFKRVGTKSAKRDPSRTIGAYEIVPNQRQRDIAARIIELRDDDGLNWNHIADTMNEEGHRDVTSKTEVPGNKHFTNESVIRYYIGELNIRSTEGYYKEVRTNAQAEVPTPIERAPDNGAGRRKRMHSFEQRRKIYGGFVHKKMHRMQGGEGDRGVQ